MIQPIRIIARREIGDIMSDWRILIPMFILTFLLPQIVIAGAAIAIDFVGDTATVAALMPFVALLVGFIPASFSLIAALEAFVGERERNSLESLLSMPISDTQLYMGKLISSLCPPLISSYTAMCVFLGSLNWLRPDLFALGVTFETFVLVLVLIGAKAVVMVAGAVIISSHTSSIRAANLLASFVLLPTAAIIQIEALLVIAGRWDMLWIIALGLVVVAIALIRTGLGAFNREEILSREHEQLNLKRMWQTFTTFLREYQTAGLAVEGYTGRRFSLSYFYRHELWQLIRDYRLPLGVALFGAVGGMVSGGYIGQNYSIRFMDVLLNNVGTTLEPGLGLGIGIFFNNIRVALLSSLLSLFCFGTFAFLVPTVAFAQVAFVANALDLRGGDWLSWGPDSPLQFLVAYVLPHGIVELPTAILGAALGIRLGASLMSPPKYFTVGTNILWSLAQFFKVWALVIVPMFLLGGLIEGLITPRIVQWLYQ